MKLPKRIVNRKKAIAEFDLSQKIVECVPKISADQRIVKAAELYQKPLAEQKSIPGKLGGLQDSPNEPATKFDIQQDARKLLAGEELENLTGPSSASQRAVLLRRLRALQLAVPSAQVKLQEANIAVIREESEKIKGLAEGYETETLRCFEQLRVALKNQSKFYQYLGQRGFSSAARPYTWKLTDIEQSLLFGAPGISCLEFYVAERKKHWKFQ